MVDLTAEEIKQAARDKADREASVRAQLNAEAERVMNESRPTPTQAEMDAIKSGRMHHDEKEDPENPAMPSVAEQQARMADAGTERPAYRTRQMKSARSLDEDRLSADEAARRTAARSRVGADFVASSSRKPE